MRVARLLVLAAVGVIFYGGCGGDDERKLVETADEGPGDGDNGDGDGDGDEPDASEPYTNDDDASLPPIEMTDAAGDAADAGPEYVAENCGGVTCSGTKKCVQDSKGAYCDCDTGFVKLNMDDGSWDCILDEQCVFIRGLTHGCRHNLGPDPVVATTFTVEYCGGVPVPPEVVGELGSAFVLKEDNSPIDLTESAAIAVPTTADLVVTLALDVSGSVLANEQVLSPLISQLRGFVSHLARPAGEPPVTISVLVFGRGVAEYVSPTVNLQDVDAALAAIETDQSRVTDIVQTNGTALYDAVKEGIDQTERLIELRHLISQGGTLSSGTLVVVTDGNNESGAVTLNTGRINGSLVHVVSVGINADIDDRELGKIGRDGSFLAPDPEDWQDIFDEIASRITNRLQSVYRVAYCSPSTEADHKLSVMLANVPDSEGLSCGFDAGNFIEQPPPSADAGAAPPANVFASCQQFITNMCDFVDPNDGVRRCDTSAMACGSECLPGECCNGFGECVAPGPDLSCISEDQFCRPGNNRCFDGSCVPPTPVGESCEEVGCEEGVGWCAGERSNDAGETTRICLPITRDLGDPCDVDAPDPEHQCSTLNCAKDPAQNSDIFYCRHPAQVFDLCSGANAEAVCETGTHCEGSGCKVRIPDGEGPCKDHSDCAMGWCDKGASNRCGFSTTCHFAWSDKVAQ
jgi:hypothetical protein